MKQFKYLALALITMLSLASCKKEVVEKGAPEVDGCAGVYFPTQKNTGALLLDPSDPTEVTYTAKRTNAEGSITVPCTVIDTSGLFKVEPIKFDDGQEETTFKVSFPGLGVGREYALDLMIEDPKYALVYSNNPTSISLVVTRIKWNNLGKAKYRDDIFSSIYSLPKKYAEVEIDIYERDDKKGYYRITSLYAEPMLAAMWNNTYPESDFKENVTTKNAVIYINATDPAKVYIPYQNTGSTVSSKDGEIWFASFSPECFQKGDVYGTLKDGVLKFPVNGLIGGTKGKPSWECNRSGMFRLIMPGARDFDFTLALSAGQSDNAGKLPVNIAMGLDLKKVKYAIFNGSLSASDVKTAAIKIKNGEVASEEVTASGTVNVTMDNTGVYTLVAVGFDDKDAVQASSSTSFSYLKAGDDTKSVVLNAGLLLTNQYANYGYTTENSLLYYFSGKEIKSLVFDIVETDVYDAAPDETVKKILKEVEFEKDSVLLVVNDKGASGIFDKLSPGTGYTLVAVASNGFKTQVFTAKATTGGQPKDVYKNYTSDKLTKDAGIDAFVGTWNFYAKNLASKTPDAKRKFYGKVEATKLGTDVLVVKGLMPISVKAGATDDGIQFKYEDGYLYSMKADLGTVNIKGTEYTEHVMFGTKNEKIYFTDYALLAGPVNGKKDFAFVGDPEYESNYGLSFNSLIIGLKQAGAFVGTLERWGDMLFVDPATDDSGLATSSVKTELKPAHESVLKATGKKLNSLNAIKVAVPFAPEMLLESVNFEANVVERTYGKDLFATKQANDFSFIGL